MSSEESQPSQSAAQPEPVGVQLRKAREASGFSVAHVAEHQHLRPKVIQAIEDCDYRQIDSDLFLKGYVRIFSNQVGLDSDALVAQLDRELEPLRKEREEAARADPLQDIERRKRRKRRVARSLLLVVVLAVLVFGGVRVATLMMETDITPAEEASSVDDIPDDEDMGEGENAFDQADRQDEDSEYDAQPLPESSGEDSPPAGQRDADDPVQSGGVEPGLSEEIVLVETTASARAEEPDSPDGELPAAEEPEAGGPETAEPGTENQAEAEVGSAGDDEPAGVSGSEDQATTADSPEISEVDEPEPDRIDADREARLMASFSGECWVQITDAGGRTVFAGLQQEGDEIDVEGVAPLDVVFGNASAVDRIEFDGEAVDRSDWQIRNNRVALTLRI